MPDPDERDELITRLAAMQRDVARALAPDREPPYINSTLTMQQLRVVVSLGIDGPASGQDLAGKLRVALGTVTGIVDRLVAQGMVERGEDPQDRRVRRVRLSPAGVELVDKLLDAGTTRFRRLLEHVDTDTLREFERVMVKLQEAAGRLRES